MKLPALIVLLLVLPLGAATTVVPTPDPGLNAESGPAKEAYEMFKNGRYRAAVEAAQPLAEEGNGDALFLLGAAAESGQGMDTSRDKALDYYKRASQAGHKEATYRRALILLNSKDEAERAKSRDELEAAAQNDPSTAGRLLGDAWLRGLLSEQPDFDKTVQWWTRAADSGDTAALILLARLYSGDLGFADHIDQAKAVSFYQRAADQGDKNAWLPLGSRLLNGDPSIREEKRGRELVKKAVEDGQTLGWLALGDFEENQKKDLAAAYAAYLEGAQKEQPNCMLAVARFNYQALGRDKNEEEGRKWLDKAAEAGNPVANLEIAHLLAAAEKPDITAVYSHLLAAAAGGSAPAQNELGLLYLSKQLGGTDASAAAAWFTRAAKIGLANAQNNLAALYEQGVGVDQSYANAGQLYSLAANQGHAEATAALARLYASGSGTARDLPKAWALASLAIERGDEKAKEMLDVITPELDAEQLASAKKQLEDLKGDTPATEQKTEEPETLPEEKQNGQD